ncbi:MAG: DUF4870 domain-containing protein [Chloroflexota bacterium]
MEKSSTGLNVNTAALLCYVLGWISGLVFFILEKDSKFVRFHALQSIIVFGILSLASSFLNWLPYIGGILSAAIGVVTLVLWIVLMVKASKGEKYKVWWAGDFADRQIS